MKKHIFISAGETSGDSLGSQLITALTAKDPTLKITAMGGNAIKAAGADIIVDSSRLAIVGFWEVIKHIGTIYAAFKRIKQLFKQDKPDLVICIDYPGFNLRLAQMAKKKQCKVMYYVSPQIWAWHYGRINKIKQCVDHVSVLFPFEKTLYDKEKVPATYVGHPLIDQVKSRLTPEQVYQRFALAREKPIIVLLPGSRRQELQRLLPTMISAVDLIKQQQADAQFVLLLADHFDPKQFNHLINTGIQIIQHYNYELLSVASAAITSSGTMTLEVALMATPMVIIYKMAALSGWIAHRLVLTRHAGLCNIVLGKTAAKEILQEDVKARAIADEIVKLLNDTTYRQQMISRLKQVRTLLTLDNCAKRANDVALSLLAQQ